MNDYVAFSGGVDSTALALLMPDAVPVFTDTVWEFDHIYDHIERFERVTGRKVVRLVNKKYPGGIPQYITHSKFMPNHGARYCTHRFKIEPLNAWLNDVGTLPAVLNVALRADEPSDQRVGNLTDMEGLTVAYPLRDWGMVRIDVVRVCIEYDLLPRYPAYAARGGCKGCFYKRKSEVLAMSQLVPDVLDELQLLEEGVQDERGKFFYMFPNVGKSIAEIKAQPPLFDFSEVYADAADVSDYGQNCGLFCNR